MSYGGVYVCVSNEMCVYGLSGSEFMLSIYILTACVCDRMVDLNWGFCYHLFVVL